MAKSQGTVKFFDSKKGFGFIKQHGGGEVFLGARALEAAGILSVKEGDLLSFDVIKGKGRSPQASNIEKQP